MLIAASRFHIGASQTSAREGNNINHRTDKQTTNMSAEKKTLGGVASAVILVLIVGGIILAVVLGLVLKKVYPEIEIVEFRCRDCTLRSSGKYSLSATVRVSVKNTLKKDIVLKSFSGTVKYKSTTLGTVSEKNTCTKFTPTTLGAGKTVYMCFNFNGNMGLDMSTPSAAIAYCKNDMTVSFSGKAKAKFGKLRNILAFVSYDFKVRPKSCECSLIGILC